MLIDFAGYAEDCRISGRLELAADRLSDLLNSGEPIVLQEATLESLADGHAVPLGEFLLERDDLLVVEAGMPRGHQGRRIRTISERLEARIGPYAVLGRLHAHPGARALDDVGRRPPFLALTDATLAYVRGGRLDVHDTPTLIVNRLQTDWLRASVDEQLEFPGVPFLERLSGRFGYKDMTTTDL